MSEDVTASTVDVSDSARQPYGPLFGGDVTSAQQVVGTRYEVLRLAGAGGMGSVFAARDTLLHRTVAIKISRSAQINQSDAAARERLVAEARAMAGLRHPNLCRVLEVAVDAPSPYMVMEWTDGIHLTDAARSLRIDDRLRLFERVCVAVSAAHRAGVAHRDLKPQNILVDSRGEPVVVDFGLARSSSGQPAGLTSAGTPGYAPPEQMMGQAEDWFRADVFSLGVILFELLTGRRPFEGKTTAETARMMRENAVPLPEDITPETPEAVQRICLKALERAPADRYADASEMALDIARYFRGEPVAARPTQLAGRFQEHLEEQMLAARVWRKHGLITDRECDRLVNILTDLQRPESPWVVDSRRLTFSQVSLYLGGWIILIGVLVGMSLVWNELNRAWLIGGAMLGASVLMGLGFTLRRVGRELASVVHFMAGVTVAPASLWLLFRDTGWLADAPGATSPRFFSWALGFDETPAGLGGVQLACVGILWCGLCLLMRWYTHAAAFSWLGSIAGLLTWFVLWTATDYSIGTDGRALAFARFGVWMSLGGCASLLPIAFRGWAEERGAVRVGPRRRRPRDSGPLLAATLISLVVGLSAIAWFEPKWLGIPAIFATSSHTLKTSLAFMTSGILQQAASMLLTARPWRAGSHGATALRWLVPNHICGAMVYLHIDRTGDNNSAALAWLVLLSLAAVSFISLSVVRQWKPFLFSGLAYLTVAYIRAFSLVDACYPRAEVMPPERHTWHAILVAGALAIGLLVMLAAWAFPDVRHRIAQSPLVRRTTVRRVVAGRPDDAGGPHS